MLTAIAVLSSVSLSQAGAGASSAPLFKDGFETGDFGLWSKAVGLVSQQAQSQVISGTWSARGDTAATNAGRTYAVRNLSSASPEMYFRTAFRLNSRITSIILLRFRTSANASLLALGVNGGGKLYLVNGATGLSTRSVTVVTNGQIHDLQLHANVNTGAVDVWFDGTKVNDLSKPMTFDSNASIGKLELGEIAGSRSYDVLFDDVIADTSLIDTVPPSQPTGLVASASTSPWGVHLTWTKSTDNVGVESYRVFRDGQAIATTVPTDPNAPDFTDTTVAGSSSYSYSVAAVDTSGNPSAPSNPYRVGTPPDPRPTVPMGVATASPPRATHVDLSWNASTDNVAVTGYEVFRSGVHIGYTNGATTTFSDTGVNPSQPDAIGPGLGSGHYDYTVKALDADGNMSGASAPLHVDVPDPVVMAAGDIACDPTAQAFINNGLAGSKGACRMLYTSDILQSAKVFGNLTDVLAMGDTQYYCGGKAAYDQSYDPTWGRVKSLTRPTPGDHEYRNQSLPGTNCSPANDLAGYHAYFDGPWESGVNGDPAHGYYSFDRGTWHIVVLNSNCNRLPGPAGDSDPVSGCKLGSPEEQWLAQDLVSHPTLCTLAFSYKGRFSSGTHGSDPLYDPFWQDMYRSGVDVVLSAHAHDYERFKPQDPNGVASAAYGVRAFVVGTGGVGHQSLPAAGSRLPNSVVGNDHTFGVLRLALKPTSYDWAFVPEEGKTFNDSGTGSCHGAPPA